MGKLFALALLALAACAEAQEYFHFGKPYRMYGLYRRRYTNPNVLASSGNGEQYSGAAIDFNKNSKSSYYEEAIATIEVTTQSVIFDGKTCTKFRSYYEDLPTSENDLRRMTKDQRFKVLMAKCKRTIETVVDQDGKVVLVYSDFVDGNGRVEVWAKFNKDDIDITVKKKDGERKLKVNPALGVEAFSNPVPLMLKSDESLREPRKFCCIDYKTGGISTYTIRYRSKFTGKLGQEKITGKAFELTAPEGTRILLVNDKGELMQVDYNNERDYIQALFSASADPP